MIYVRIWGILVILYLCEWIKSVFLWCIFLFKLLVKWDGIYELVFNDSVWCLNVVWWIKWVKN